MIPRLFDGRTVACVASGPSLTESDVGLLSGLPIIAINDAIRLVPQADVLYSSDHRWWKWFHRSPYAQTFTGQKYAIGRCAWPDVQVLKNTGADGLEVSPTGLKNYRNSGGAAINLAVHVGAARILLLGYDMAHGPKGRNHFHDDVCLGSPYAQFRKHIATMVEPLRTIGVTVINCSRHTRLECFPRVALEEAIACEVAA